MSDDQLFFVPDRQLAYPVFDSDNHMYENTEAFTKFLPPQYEGIIRYIQESDNRTKLAVKDRITRAITNPTFQRVAPPGGQADDPLHRRSIPGMDAFFDVEPRYKLMNEFGITRALMWPTLASVIEQALPEDPLATHAVIHALNEWMYEHWTFGYEDTVFADARHRHGDRRRSPEGARVGDRAGSQRSSTSVPRRSLARAVRALLLCPSSIPSGRRCRRRTSSSASTTP